MASCSGSEGSCRPCRHRLRLVTFRQLGASTYCELLRRHLIHSPCTSATCRSLVFMWMLMASDHLYRLRHHAPRFRFQAGLRTGHSRTLRGQAQDHMQATKLVCAVQSRHQGTAQRLGHSLACVGNRHHHAACALLVRLGRSWVLHPKQDLAYRVRAKCRYLPLLASRQAGPSLQQQRALACVFSNSTDVRDCCHDGATAMIEALPVLPCDKFIFLLVSVWFTAEI